MRFVVWSDTHMQHKRIPVPDGDVLIHAGDFSGQGSLDDVEYFNEFLGSLPHTYKILIAGNHDWALEREPLQARSLITNAIYLQDSSIELNGIKIYGSPWQPEFFNWAFNLPRGVALREKWAQIPDDTNILITHGPPHGILDTVRTGFSVGCEELRNAVDRIRPQFHVFGHIHEAAGIEMGKHTTFINAAVLNKPKAVFSFDYDL